MEFFFHIMKTLRSGCIAPLSLTSTVDGREWSASRPGLFTSRERALVTDWIREWVGLMDGLDEVEKSLVPAGIRTPSVCITCMASKTQLIN
jgi:hypothetical protein